MSENPVLVEIIAYAPTAYYHCTHCEVAWREMGVTNRIHQEQVASSLPPDLAQEYQVISEWIRAIFQRYSDRVVIRMLDAASIEGFWKSLRYGVRRYPSLIVNHRARFRGEELDAAGKEIARLLENASPIQG